MKWILWVILVLTLTIECNSGDLPFTTAHAADRPSVPILPNIDPPSGEKAEHIIKMMSSQYLKTTGEKIDFVSQQFLGTPYQSGTLKGSATQPETLIIDLHHLDCFTYLDYVASLVRSESTSDFISNLINVRYINKEISFYKRRHFFSDWAYRQTYLAQDITASLSNQAITETKQLNKKKDKDTYLPGLQPVTRTLFYIPTRAIDAEVINKLRVGDFIGIYTALPGLDVTHVGIYIPTPDGPVLRHASSLQAHSYVTESPLLPYLSNKTGIIVLRMT